jgi:hypothetical protein
LACASTLLKGAGGIFAKALRAATSPGCGNRVDIFMILKVGMEGNGVKTGAVGLV